ncbi:hypothetical protein NMY22_g9889 [Coprinellus aureogranulatus]|nr:hypothetical protein NMY22_g9889 [Coprinellus aureogranulatus]
MAPTIIPDLDFFYPDIEMKLNRGRYELLRPLGSGQHSTTWIAVDLIPPASRCPAAVKYLAVKILTRTATEQRRRGIRKELNFLRAISGKVPTVSLPRLYDDFEVEGHRGVHLCLVFEPKGPDINTFRMNGPSKVLVPHVVKKIIGDVATALAALHANNIVHADVKADNILCETGLLNQLIEEDLAKHVPEVAGEFSLEGKKHLVYSNCPLSTACSCDASHNCSEVQEYCLSGLGKGKWSGKQPTTTVLPPLALRSPEVIIGSDFGPGVDIWALGCLTFELLVGEPLFTPACKGNERTLEEDILAQIFSTTGQRFRSATLGRAQRKDRFLDAEGTLPHQLAISPVQSLITPRKPIAKERDPALLV